MFGLERGHYYASSSSLLAMYMYVHVHIVALSNINYRDKTTNRTRIVPVHVLQTN